MNKLIKLLLAVFAVTILFGIIFIYQVNEENEMLMDDVSDIKEISISKSTNFGKLNDAFFVTFKDSKELDTLRSALITAKREKVYFTSKETTQELRKIIKP